VQVREQFDADVLVVGAGPAGSSSAFHLARRGLHTLLVDRAVFPREKVCGDGLTPRAVRAMTAMGVGPIGNGFTLVRGVRMNGEGGSPVEFASTSQRRWNSPWLSIALEHTSRTLCA